MKQGISRRSFVRTTGIAAGLAPFVPSMGANVGYTNAGADLRIPQIPYGAVYFRKSYPPREDWDRDYKTASEDGVNTFRHWFIWSAIETSPGVYDWEDYDRQMELADEYGIRTVIAEMSKLVPQWVFDRYPEVLYVDDEGKRPISGISPATATGACQRECRRYLYEYESRQGIDRFIPSSLGRTVQGPSFPHGL